MMLAYNNHIVKLNRFSVLFFFILKKNIKLNNKYLKLLRNEIN